MVPEGGDRVAGLTTADFVGPLVTVRSGVTKGLFSMADVQAWFAIIAADLEARGAPTVGPYVCLHRYGKPCPCKKPNVLLFERTSSEHHLSTAARFVIGDSPDDVRAARRLGVANGTTNCVSGL